MAQVSAAPLLASVQGHFKRLLELSVSLGAKVKHSESGLGYEPSAFLRHGLAAEIITKEELEKRIVKLFYPSPASGTTVTFVNRILGVNSTGSTTTYGLGLHAILLIVLCVGRQSLLDAFKEEFLSKNRTERDEDLPFNQDTTVEIFKSEWKYFFHNQSPLVPITIAKGSFSDVYEHTRRLPYLKEEKIGEGAFGRVYRVKVERGHYRYQDPRSRNQDAVWLARKDFDPKQESYEAFEAENFILKEFLNASDCPASIMTSISSYVQFPSAPEELYPSASIFFPVARCSLKTYMENPNNFPGKSHVKRRQHVRQMLSISNGLEWLGEKLVYKDGHYVYSTYYHCDLKPDNILVCEDLNDPNSVVFKIADFGEARGLQRAPKDVPKDSRQPGRVRIPVSGRAGTFLAPEAQDDQPAPQISGISDVWAFGCIFLLVILFNYNDAEGIEEFNKEREMQGNKSHKMKGDFFFNPDRSGSDIRNKAVTEEIDNLTQRTKRRQLTEVDATFAHKALKYLKASILVQYSKRHTISEVKTNLHLYYNNESHISISEIDHGREVKDSEHCGISPNGFVFFYTPSWINFFNTHPPELREAGSEEPRTIERKASHKWHGSLKPTSRSCSTKTVCLVSSKTDDAAFKGKIHNFADPAATTPRDIEVKLFKSSDTAVRNVALSPNGELIAIAWKQKSNQAQIRLYRVDDIDIKRSGSANTSVTEPSSVRTSSSNITDNDQLRGHANFSDIKYNLDLCFSRDNAVLYHAATTTGPGPTKLRVTAWSDNKNGTWTRTQSSIRPYPDFTHRDNFLIRLVPLNKQVGFMCITHDQYITKQLLHEKERTIADQIELGDGRNLSTVLISSDDKKIVVLAEVEKTKFLEIWGGQLESRRLEKKLNINVKEKIKYSPKTDVAYLLEHGQRVTLQITFVDTHKTRSFPLDRLFED